MEATLLLLGRRAQGSNISLYHNEIFTIVFYKGVNSRVAKFSHKQEGNTQTHRNKTLNCRLCGRS